MQRFTELRVWREAHALALEVYRATATFPKEEKFGVTSQLRRAIVSVAANIAEGAKRKGRAEYARFLNVAEGSLAEVDYLLILTTDLGYLSEAAGKAMQSRAWSLARRLHALRAAVEAGGGGRVEERPSTALPQA